MLIFRLIAYQKTNPLGMIKKYLKNNQFLHDLNVLELINLDIEFNHEMQKLNNLVYLEQIRTLKNQRSKSPCCENPKERI